jgi:hypothetical protein
MDYLLNAIYGFYRSKKISSLRIKSIIVLIPPDHFVMAIDFNDAVTLSSRSYNP